MVFSNPLIFYSLLTGPSYISTETYMHSQTLGTSKVTAVFHCHNEKLYSVAGTQKKKVRQKFISFSCHRTVLHRVIQDSCSFQFVAPLAPRMLYPIHGKKVTWNLQVPYLLISHWLDFGHVVTPSCKGGWEMQFLTGQACVLDESQKGKRSNTKRKRRDFPAAKYKRQQFRKDLG